MLRKTRRIKKFARRARILLLAMLICACQVLEALVEGDKGGAMTRQVGVGRAMSGKRRVEGQRSQRHNRSRPSGARSERALWSGGRNECTEIGVWLYIYGNRICYALNASESPEQYHVGADCQGNAHHGAQAVDGELRSCT